MTNIQNQNYFFEFTLIPPDWIVLLSAILAADSLSANGLLRCERSMH